MHPHTTMALEAAVAGLDRDAHRIGRDGLPQGYTREQLETRMRIMLLLANLTLRRAA